MAVDLPGSGRAADQKVLRLLSARRGHIPDRDAVGRAICSGQSPRRNHVGPANVPLASRDAAEAEETIRRQADDAEGEDRAPRCVVPEPARERTAEVILPAEEVVHAVDGVALALVRD